MDLIKEYCSFSSSTNRSFEFTVQDLISEEHEEPSPASDSTESGSGLLSKASYTKLTNRRKHSGKSYITSAGKTREKRTCSRLGKCRNDCRSKISRENQLQIFKSYWSQGCYPKRANFVRNLITIESKIASKGKKRTRRFTALYKLTTDLFDATVCRQCFRLTLGETESFLESILSKMWKDNNTPIRDNRGKACSNIKTSVSKVEEIQNHIKKFPAYKSHYARSHTSKKYLQVGLNVTKMYLYKSQTLNAASLKIYRQVFNKTGLKFKQPQLDRCHKCDLYSTQIKYETDETTRCRIIEQQSAHHKAAELAYTNKRIDKNIARESSGKHIHCTFDLQQCLPTPFLQTSVSFYKRQLWTYNLTVSNNTTGVTTCFMWHEATGKKGGNEIASCLHKFLDNLEPQVEHVTLYSDNCSGQNKNKIVCAMLSTAVYNHRTLQTVDHKFLESGHSHMECDSDHSLIERAKKKCPDIHHPDDWYNLVRNCSTKKKMKVVVMTKNDFYNFEKISKHNLISRQKNTKGDRFLWQPVKWLRYKKTQGVVHYKCNLVSDGVFDSLDLRRNDNVITQDNYELCYSEELKISREKKNDLLSILNLLRPEVRSFYQNLPYINEKSNTNIDSDLDEYQDVEEPNMDTNCNKINETKQKQNIMGHSKIITPKSTARKSNRIAQKRTISYRDFGYN